MSHISVSYSMSHNSLMIHTYEIVCYNTNKGGMNMKIGYARVSTIDQDLQSQIDLLKKEGCDKIFTEKVSGASSHREELQKAISFFAKRDTLVVTKLDRLGHRKTTH